MKIKSLLPGACRRPRMITRGETVKVVMYQLNGVTIRPHVHSRKELGLHWVTDVGHCGWQVASKIVAIAGFDPDYVSLPVSFSSMDAACAAIASATGGAA